MSRNPDNAPVTPARAAALVGVEVYTIRRWCDWHKAHLSPLASPGPGALRKLTMRDVEVLKRVRELREQGLTTLAINEQLAWVTFAEIDDQPFDVEPGAMVASQDTPPAAPLATLALDAMQSHERRLERLERSREPALIIGIGIGAIGMGILFMLLVGLATLYGGLR